MGAGIGGLAAGVALRRRGHQVVILEKRSQFAEEGAGIVLGPNVMSALGVMGLAEPILAEGRPVTGMNITNARGSVLARSSFDVSSLPLPGVAIHRSRLHEVLLRELDGELRLGADVTTLQPGEPPFLVERGERIGCDLVIGADGIRSRARAALTPRFATRYSGYTCFRFVVDEVWCDEVFEMWGRGKRLGVVPLGHGHTYIFATLNAPARSPRPFSSVEELRALWSEFRAPGARAFELLRDLDGVLHNDLEDGLAPSFCAPGIVLLGDAAHAVTPNMGQGAGLAVEDGCCLAALLERPKPLAELLAEYEALRRPRAEWILERSYSLGKLAQLESGLARGLRDAALRLTPKAVNDAALRRIVRDMPGVPLS
jgi:2-polyprenyl-6-methoxyphenol hydroxylase-like FAD-dependent oxidoreductase